MSFLAPLFLLGALAVVGPVIFHLIRRTTRDRVPFSSLMFLQPTPPRLTRRSRIEHWLLLALRALALALLALAFARPFLNSPATPPPARAAGGRTLLLVDTSASLRREGLWPSALAAARDALASASSKHDVAVLAFDRGVREVLSFETWKSLDPATREAEAKGRIDALVPTWHGTDLASALTAGAEALVEGDTDTTGAPRELVLISDLQAGGRLDAIQTFDWPKGVEVRLAPILSSRPGNAGLQLAAEASERAATPQAGVRVRVTNAADSTGEVFQVGWSDETGEAFAGTAVDAYVPPGQSRLLTVPWPSGTPVPGRVRLSGDAETFDNLVAAAPLPQTRVAVLHFGREGEDDPKLPVFFLKRALPDSPRLTATVTTLSPDAPPPPDQLTQSHFLVVTAPLAPAVAQAVRDRVTAGATALVALHGDGMAGTLSALAGLGSMKVEEVTPRSYAMFGEIDFRHPVFAPFADPRFSDFTKIRFQRHRGIDASALPGARVLARFDSGHPALIDFDAGRGRVAVLAAGWVPPESQFAVSSKFPSWLASLLEWSGATALTPSSFVVGDTIPRRAFAAAEGIAVTVRPPSGEEAVLPAESPDFGPITEPGLYQASVGSESRAVPVTLDPQESRTSPLAADDFEKLGVPMASAAERARQTAARQEVAPAAEAESRQKLWRWCLLAALAVVLLETLLAGLTARRQSTVTEATP